ncbi:hypothetical protein BELL_1014g00020 [Botrytis elliptica]|uniref:Mid2 domain-containing protein n=1 Tax=Botrytis elliptica TaxID=278938 RepID=A0A4Z1IV29_9HELO|nr:hypothetical protein EAE99_001508 [Botrytis elliptica]TGO65329.1 hypothetical protein BELL_1014g00020 [Botrytis elliptica]
MIFSLFMVSSSLLPAILAKALPWTPAVQTSTADNRAPVQGGWSPSPTAAPNNALKVLDLLKRQTTANNTCGYYNGIQSEPYTCSGAGYCAHNSYSAVGCCTGDINSCDIFTACIDYSSSSALCALADGLTGCCNDSDFPYCATFLWNNPQRSMYRCVTSPAFYLMSDYPITGTASTTVVSSVTLSRSVASVASSIQSGDDAQDISSASRSSVTSASARGSVTSAGSRSSASSSSLATPFATTTAHKKSGVPLGAIIGGAVGGVAVIALLIFAIVFFVRKKKSNRSQPQPPPQVSTTHPNNLYQGVPPNSPPPFYDNRTSIAKPAYPMQHTTELANTVYIPPAIPEYYQPPKDDVPISPNSNTHRFSNSQIYSDPGHQYSELDATALDPLNGNRVELGSEPRRPSHGTEISPTR